MTWLAAAKSAVITTGAVVLASWAAPPSTAQDPCDLGVTFLCHFMPIAPDLEGDVDFTTQLPPAPPDTPQPPPLEPCAQGCV